MSDGLVRILTTPDVFEGLIVRSRLEDEGIPVMTSGDESPYRVGPVHVFVPVEYEVQARLLIETLRASDPDAAEAAFDAERRAETPGTAEVDEPEKEERA
jgi:hypothetical protein